ncbi:ROK family transcriptional regulator [Microbacterium sp. STN6]|uniref:ROK family transcriptional regulator n=1 Tax=Microbacterium sp. STN6 TaxID=2995588 RepID=UPI00226087D5|nr:ROK family transcriptional regulator [Microbacterium sp. STN6]MCX7522585.1 ROK family transcriptional regulator [Microbacterium sp. STN6]
MSLSDVRGLRISGPPSLTTSDDLRRGNAASVLRAVLVGGPQARAELADRLALTRATITRVAGQLVEAGLLREGEPRRAATGRPMIPLELGDSERVAATVHLGVTEIRIGIVSIRGEVLLEQRHPYRQHDPESVAELIASGLDEALEASSATGRLLGLSASIGGWIDPSGETIVEYLPLEWQNVPLPSLLPDFDGLPRYFDQLVRGLALAESMFGAAKGSSDFLEIWSGNILGSAFVSEGVLRRGPRGGAGGIDHFPTALEGAVCSCGRTGCLGTVATDSAITDAAVAEGILRPGGSMRTLLEIARDGDRQANELIGARARELGRAAALMVDLVNPGMVVVAGLVTTAPGYLEAFRSTFSSATQQAALTPVVTSAFGDLAPTVASASFLLDAFFHDPLAFEPKITV